MTGTFDNWSKSEQMEKVGDKFEKSVELPDTSERIYYKVGTQTNLAFFRHVFSYMPATSHTFPINSSVGARHGIRFYDTPRRAHNGWFRASARLRACVRACLHACLCSYQHCIDGTAFSNAMRCGGVRYE